MTPDRAGRTPRYYHDCSIRIPGHTTRAPPAGFELETNGFHAFVRVAPHISAPLMRCGCARHCAALRGVLLPPGARAWLGGGDGDGGQVARWWTGMSLSPLTSSLARRQWRRGALVDGEIASLRQ